MAINWDIWLVVGVLFFFNLPIALACWHFRGITGLAEIVPSNGDDTKIRIPALVQEKDAEGNNTGAVSYSRVTGLIGAVVVSSLFWIMSNVSIAVSILNPSDLPNILNAITKLFFVGASLFLPYAFNQLKSLLQ
jgi:hypothetical protein